MVKLENVKKLLLFNGKNRIHLVLMLLMAFHAAIAAAAVKSPSLAGVTTGSAIHLVWIDSPAVNNSINYTKSINYGKSWLQKKSLVNGKSHFCFPPEIAAAGSYIHCAWVDFGQNKNGEIRYLRSKDDGNSWDNELVLIDEARDAAMVTLKASGENVYLCWRERSGRINFMASYDKGETWEKEIMLARAGGADEYCPAPLISSQGRRVACYWGSVRENRHGLKAYVDVIPLVKGELETVSSMDYVQSADEGKTWTVKPKTYISSLKSDNDTEILVYPLLQLDGNIQHLFWIGKIDKKHYTINYRMSSDSALSWAAEESVSENIGSVPFVSAAISSGNVHAAWSYGKRQKISVYYKKKDIKQNIWPGEAMPIASNGNFQNPLIIAASDGSLNIFFLQNEDESSKLIQYSSHDNGDSWQLQPIEFK